MNPRRVHLAPGGVKEVESPKGPSSSTKGRWWWWWCGAVRRWGGVGLGLEWGLRREREGERISFNKCKSFLTSSLTRKKDLYELRPVHKCIEILSVLWWESEGY